MLKRERAADELLQRKDGAKSLPRLRTVAVDLTPVLPGGENGGAKIFVLELLQRLAGMQPDTRFMLLTQSAAHQELAWLDAPNISRLQVLDSHAVAGGLRPRLQALLERLLRHLPGRLTRLAMRLACHGNRMMKRGGSGRLLSRIGADLLFCPFTAPTYYEDGIPTVCTLYDLQYRTYPEFFSPQDVAHRHQTFVDACRRATLLVAISDYTRDSVLRHGGIDPQRIRTIPLRMAQAAASRPDAAAGVSGNGLPGLIAGRYLIYPANFWRHKNHEMLLTAFGMACASGLDADIRLVCTGAPGERQRQVQQAAVALGLGGRVLFPGFVPAADLAALIANARGMIFPSLYEGFGMPVIEAMAAGIPVACSRVTALPEVAAGAALLFDPRLPQQIAEAMIVLAGSGSRRQQLVVSGRQRALGFCKPGRMAAEYWALFLAALDPDRRHSRIDGVDPEGCCRPHFSLQLRPSSLARTLEMELSLPDSQPVRPHRLEVIDGVRELAFDLPCGTTALSLPVPAGCILLCLHLVPVPGQGAAGDEDREQAPRLTRCMLRGAGGDLEALYP